MQYVTIGKNLWSSYKSLVLLPLGVPEIGGGEAGMLENLPVSELSCQVKMAKEVFTTLT